jgi:hypothetical protein
VAERPGRRSPSVGVDGGSQGGGPPSGPRGQALAPRRPAGSPAGGRTGACGRDGCRRLPCARPPRGQVSASRRRITTTKAGKRCWPPSPDRPTPRHPGHRHAVGRPPAQVRPRCPDLRRLSPCATDCSSVGGSPTSPVTCRRKPPALRVGRTPSSRCPRNPRPPRRALRRCSPGRACTWGWHRGPGHGGRLAQRAAGPGPARGRRDRSDGELVTVAVVPLDADAGQRPAVVVQGEQHLPADRAKPSGDVRPVRVVPGAVVRQRLGCKGPSEPRGEGAEPGVFQQRGQSRQDRGSIAVGGGQPTDVRGVSPRD